MRLGQGFQPSPRWTRLRGEFLGGTGAVLLRSVVFLVGLLLAHSAALAEMRFALLIGNQAYTPEIGALLNPHNDVALLERTLKTLGFQVTTVRDADLATLTRAVNAYTRRLAADGGPNALGFFYYSGHGAADGGTNYLIPIDVKTTETGELWDQSLRLTEITRKLRSEAGSATHFVVFDACRNTLKLRKPGTRALVQSKGFVPVMQENGMLIAYATAEGELASDVGDGAGPYAKVLANEIVKPGVEAVTMFRRVQVRVCSSIGQEPWLGFSALAEVHFAGVQTEAAKSGPPDSGSDLAELAWALAKDSTSLGMLEGFIARFKDTHYADLARARIEELKKRAAPKQPEVASTSAEPPKKQVAFTEKPEIIIEAERSWANTKDQTDIAPFFVFAVGRFRHTPFSHPARSRVDQLMDQQIAAVSGFKIDKNAFFYGDIFDTPRTDTLAECAQRCLQTPLCIAIDWDTRKKCRFFKKIDSANTTDGAWGSLAGRKQ